MMMVERAVSERPLHGLCVLVAEDDYFIAIEMCSLRGRMAFQLATELRARGIPAVFATGYDASMIPAELADMARLEKPVDLAALCRAIEAACP